METMLLTEIAIKEFIYYSEVHRNRSEALVYQRKKEAKFNYKIGRMKPLVIIHTDLGWTLVDGYVRYQFLKEAGITEYFIIKREGQYDEIREEYKNKLNKSNFKKEMENWKKKNEAIKKEKREAQKKKDQEEQRKSFFSTWMRSNHPFKESDNEGYMSVCRALHMFNPSKNELEIYFKHVEKHTKKKLRDSALNEFLQLWTQYFYEDLQNKSA